MQPQHRRTRLGLHGVRDFRHEGGTEAERSRSQAAIFKEAAAGDALAESVCVFLVHTALPIIAVFVYHEPSYYTDVTRQ